MPADPTPDGQGILNKPVVKPFPEPTPADDTQEGDDRDAEARRDQARRDSLITLEMEEPAETVRPPLGN